MNGQKYGGRQRHETPEQGAQRQYPQVDLHDGDVIRVGLTVLEVKVEGAVQADERISCQRCGKDVSAEVGSAGHGEMRML